MILNLLFGSSIFKNKMGTKAEDGIITFDKEKISDNLLSIKYLYGQLLSKHKQINASVSINDIAKKYTGENWTTNSRYINGIFTFGYSSRNYLYV